MHPSGYHESITVDAEEGPPLSLGGEAQAFVKALTEGSGVPYAVTQIGTPHGGFVFLQHLIQGALDGRQFDVQVRPAGSAWKRFRVDRATAVAHPFQEILPSALPGASRVLKVCSREFRTMAGVGVEDTVKGSVEVRSIAWVAHVSGKNGSNV